MNDCCRGCGKDMSAYSDAEREEGWCIECAPELYQWDATFGSGVDPVSGVEAEQR